MAKPDRALRSMIRESYLVTLETETGEEGFEGVLYDVDDNWLVFVRASAIDPETDARVPIDGQLWLPRPRVKYLQTTRL